MSVLSYVIPALFCLAPCGSLQWAADCLGGTAEDWTAWGSQYELARQTTTASQSAAGANPLRESAFYRLSL